ncbi:MAG: hypothetical protein AB8G17_06150 [Gammaproteobacteria bacterium]
MNSLINTLATAALVVTAAAPTAHADRVTPEASAISPVSSTGQVPTTAKHAVTMWWVIFNQPDLCLGSPDPQAKCTSADVFGQPFLDSMASGSPDPSLIAPNAGAEIAVLFATGGLTSPSGQIRLVASLYETKEQPLAGLPQGVDPMGFGRGFENPQAEVHLVVRSHGAPVPGGELSQITNFLDPYCSDPNLHYFAGPNLCADQQFAVFGAAEVGNDSVYRFASPTQSVRRANVNLQRDGEALRVVLETQLD